METRNYQSGAAPSAPAAPASPSNGFPTSGNPTTGTPATQPGAFWFHKISEELRNVIIAAGLTPSDADLTQLTQSVKSGKLLNVQIFTATGTYTPSTGTNSVVVEALGGGGGGGNTVATGSTTVSAGAGGGAGSYGKSRYTSGFSGVTVTIGAGGAGGSNGGTTSFGALLSCPGGSAAGTSATTVVPAISPSGVGVGGSTPSGANIVAANGQNGFFAHAPALTSGYSGTGGGSCFGNGGASRNLSSNGAGFAATGYGAGGSGATTGTSNTANSGGAGSAGICIIYEYA